MDERICINRGITGLQYIQYTRPVVYGWKRKGRYLYIGCSIHGLARIFDNSHHVIKRGSIERDDFIEITACYDVDDMVTKEIQMIRKHKPEYNTVRYRSRHANLR